MKEDGEICIVGVDSGTPRVLAPHPAPDAGPGFSFDGKWVYFNSRRTGTWKMWRVPSRGGAPEQVGGPGGDYRFSADGWLYVYRVANYSLLRARPDGSDEQVVVNDMPDRRMWTLWGNVPIIRRGDVLYKLNASSHELVEFQRLDRGAPCEGFDVSPDGRTVIYCAAQSQGDIILVENFR
jgi:hypothetical protein